MKTSFPFHWPLALSLSLAAVLAGSARAGEFARGYIRKEIYLNYTAGIDNLITNEALLANPSISCLTNIYELNASDSFDNYAARMSGFFVATETGPHIFYIASAGSSRLFLSTDDDPANKLEIAREPVWANRRQWNGSGGGLNMSGVLDLVAGQCYYIESYMVAGVGSDHMAVAVKIPSDAMFPTNGSTPITSLNLGIFAAPEGGSIAIIQQPQNQTVSEYHFATFGVAANTSSPACGGTPVYQWRRNGYAILGANNPSYTIGPVTIAGDNGAVFSVEIFVPGLTTTSAVATLTVFPDTQAPTMLLAFGGTKSCDKVTVVFNELVERGTAEDTFNYSIPGLVLIAADLNPDGTSVALFLEGQAENTLYTVRCANVQDLAGNVIMAPGNTVQFRSFVMPTLTVRNLNDGGPDSLRQTILDACPGNSIIFAPAIAGTITLTSGELLINRPLNIIGPGARALTISGNNASRVFHITGGVSQISNLRIANGHASAGGGGIALEGSSSLTVSNCVITDCYAQGVDVASQGGGAIAVVGSANLAIIASTLSSNTTPYAGGGLYLFNAPTVSLINSTVSGNRTLDGDLGDGGGGIFVGNGSTLNVSGSTIANNSTVVQGGGVYKGLSGTVRVGNSLIAGNTAGGLGPDCKGTFVSAGYNLIGNSIGSTGFGATGDQLNLNAQIGALADNGGPTFTHALLTGSPAIDKGHNFSFGTDQRGGVRIVDFPNIPNAPGGDGSDIGAVEAGGYLRITDLRTNGPQVNIFFTTDPGWPYSVESKDAMVPGPWTRVPSSTRTGDGAVLTVPDTRPRVTKRFYRAVMTEPTTQVVYANNFEGAVGAEWSVPQAVSTTPVGGRSFLGEFASTVVTLQLANLPSHMHLSVSFDLFILKSWDGNRTDFGPDRWTLSLRGGATLVDTTFTLDPAGTQAYPGAFGANYPGLTGAAEHNTLGYAFGMVPSDSVYRLTATFNHTASSVTLDFSGVNLQDLADESWGLDNVRVETVAQP